jgi:hypothetical protein
MEGFPTYDNQQAVMTMNRAAYGDQQAAIMSGAGGFYGGAATGLQNMASDIGGLVRPVHYTPPARTYVASGGFYQQHTGLLRGLAGQVGLSGGDVPRGVSAYEYHTNMAQDVGERVATGAVSTAAVAGGIGAGVATAGIAGIAGGYVGGAAGAAIGSMFGPIGTVAGAAIGRGVGALAGNLAAYTVGMTGAGAITDSISQRREIQSFLSSSSFRFAGTGSALSDGNTTGAGMARDTRREIANFVRSRDVADPTMDSKELTSILESGVQQGLFAGTGDLDDFKSKYKELVENVKMVTKTLHTTLEDGVKVIKDLKGIGVTGQEVQQVIGMASTTGAVAGRTAQEMVNVGLQGAEMFRGTGIEMGIGAQANMMNLASIRAARDAGTLSQEAIAQAGGEQALAQQQTARGLQFAQTQFGRGMNAAFFQGGGFNAGAFNQAVAGGGMDFTTQAQMAAGNLSSPAAIINYEANQHKFLSEMGNQFGGKGLQMGQMASAASYATYLANQTGASREDAYRFAAQRMLGMSPQEIDAQLAEMEGADSIFAASQKGAQATRMERMVEEGYNNFVFNRMGARISDAVGGAVDVVADPMNRFIDNTGAAFRRFKEEQVLGLQRVSTANIGTGAFEGVDTSAAADRVDAALKGATDIDTGGILSTSAGEQISEALDTGVGAAFGITEDNITRQRMFLDPSQKLRDRDVVLNEGNVGFDKRVSVDREALRRAMSTEYANYDITLSQAREMNKGGKLDEVQGGLASALLRGATEFDENDPNVVDKLARSAFGVNAAKDLSKEQYAKLVMQASGTRFEGAFGKLRQFRKAVGNADNAVSVAALGKTVALVDDLEEKLESAYGMDDMSRELSQNMAAAVTAQAQAEAEPDPEKKKALLKKAGELTKNTLLMAERELGQGGASQMREAIFDPQNKKGRDIAMTLGEASKRVHEMSSEMGTRVLMKAAEVQLAEKKGLSDDERKAARDAVRALEGGITSLDDEQIEALKDAGIATGIVQQRDAIKQIQRAGGMEGDEQINAVEKALRQSGMSGKDIVAQTTALRKGTIDINDIVKKITTDFGRNVVGDEVAASGGGSSVMGDDQGASAQEQFARQTAINQEILSAMKGLATRLRVGQ